MDAERRDYLRRQFAEGCRGLGLDPYRMKSRGKVRPVMHVETLPDEWEGGQWVYEGDSWVFYEHDELPAKRILSGDMHWKKRQQNRPSFSAKTPETNYRPKEHYTESLSETAERMRREIDELANQVKADAMKVEQAERRLQRGF